MNHVRASYGVLAVLLPSLALAQDADSGNRTEQLRAALIKMSKISALAFRSVEVQDQAILRNAGIGGGQETEVSGTRANGVLTATIDEDRVAFAAGRMVAQGDDGDWKLRHDCLADGSPLPFVHDPIRTFAYLAELPDAALKVTQVEPGRSKDRDVLVYSVSLSGATAQDVTLAGLLPKASGGPGRMLVMGGGRRRTPPPETTVDFAFYVDPATNEIERLHSKTYSKSSMPGGMVMRVAGPGGIEIQQGGDEEEAAEDDSGPTPIKKGLPQRKLGKDISLTEFDVSYSKHGSAETLELTARAKTLLGLN